MDQGRILRETGLRPRKRLGQNFLVDPSVPPRIVAAAELDPAALVVEVGPGLGVLTAELAARLNPAQGCLVAVELDEALLPPLRTRMAPYPHFHLVAGDVLATDPAALMALGGRSAAAPYAVVANLPYYITSAVLRHFLTAAHPPQRLVVMVQHEVALRMTATPPAMSLLALGVQFYGRPRLVFRVPPGAFLPPPKVDSAVVRIDVYAPADRPVVADETQFFAVARAGFGQRRKQLANALADGLPLPKSLVLAALETAAILSSRRAETLTLAEWAALAAALPPDLGPRSGKAAFDDA